LVTAASEDWPAQAEENNKGKEEKKDDDEDKENDEDMAEADWAVAAPSAADEEMPVDDNEIARPQAPGPLVSQIRSQDL
jgi:hypothetical protein